MDLIGKLNNYQIDWLDIALIKVAVFAATLFFAKIWEPILSLNWYWYLIVWIITAIKPLSSFFKIQK